MRGGGYGRRRGAGLPREDKSIPAREGDNVWEGEAEKREENVEEEEGEVKEEEWEGREDKEEEEGEE
jgi:hypothetical protein